MRPNDQDRRHYQKHQNQGALRENQDPKCAEFADNHRRQIGSGETTHSADHDHDKSGRDNIKIHQEIGAALRQLNGASQTGKKGPQKENTGK